MSRNRERKLREKSQKLQLMEQLLNIQDRLGPEKQLREQMLREQMLSMVAQREQVLPSEIAFKKAQQEAMAAENSERAKRTPLQLEMLRLQNIGLAQEQRQSASLDPLRRRSLEAQIGRDEYQNSPTMRGLNQSLQEQTLRGMEEDVATKAMQRTKLLPLQADSMAAQLKAMAIENAFRSKYNPVQLAKENVNLAGQLQEQGREAELHPLRKAGLTEQVSESKYRNQADTRNQDIIIKNRQSEGLFEDNKLKALQRENLRQQIQQGGQVFPVTLEGLQLENAQRAAMVNSTNMNSPQVDPIQYLAQRHELTLPLLPSQQQVNAASNREMVERLHAGGLLPQDSYLDQLFKRKK